MNVNEARKLSEHANSISGLDTEMNEIYDQIKSVAMCGDYGTDLYVNKHKYLNEKNKRDAIIRKLESDGFICKFETPSDQRDSAFLRIVWIYE